MIVLLALRDTATFWEGAWSFFPVVGFFASLWMITDCVQDLRAAEDSDADEIIRIAAVQAVRNELIVMTIQVALGYVGFLAMLTPPIDPSRSVTVLGIAVSVAISLAAILLPIKSFWNRIDRRRMISLVRRAIRNEAREQERLDRAEAREIARDQQATDAIEQQAQALQKIDNRRDERERNLH